MGHTPWGSNGLTTVTSMLPAPPQVAPRPPAPALEQSAFLELCIEFRQCHNGPLSAPTPPPLHRFPQLSNSCWLPGERVSNQELAGSEEFIRGEIQTSSVCCSPPPLTLDLVSNLRYHLPSMEKGGERKPESSDSLHYHPH